MTDEGRDFQLKWERSIWHNAFQAAMRGAAVTTSCSARAEPGDYADTIAEQAALIADAAVASARRRGWLYQ